MNLDRSTRRSLRTSSLLLAFIPCMVLGCSSAEKPSNLLFVVVDSLRADHLSPYGHHRKTPAIAKLASQGVLFERAYSSAPWTMPSVATLFTGLEPTLHGVTNTDALLGADLETLAERLAANGYATSAVVSHHMIGKRFRFDQGFQSFDQELARGHRLISSALLTEKAGREIKRLAENPDGAPFFLFVHYFDPHYDYRDHAQFHFAQASAGRLDGSHGIGQLRRMLDSMTEEELAFLVDRYDEEIRFTDQAIGRLVELLDRFEVADNTLVVFTADHGEEFRGHGWLGHTQSLYRELVQVPLVLRGPGIEPASTVSRPVSSVNLAQTLLELLGVGGRLGTARSLAPLLTDGAPPEFEPVFCEVDYLGVDEGKPGLRTCHKKSVIGERYQLIRDDLTGELELFEDSDDPAQTRNLALDRPLELERLVDLMDRQRSRLVVGARALERTQFSDEELSALRDLGYVDSEQPPAKQE